LISSISSNTALTLESNLKYFSPGMLSVHSGSNVVVSTINAASELVPGDIIRLSANIGGVYGAYYINVTNINSNNYSFNTNVVFSQSEANIMYEVYPNVDIANTGGSIAAVNCYTTFGLPQLIIFFNGATPVGFSNTSGGYIPIYSEYIF